jgi:hypothetical protein
MCNTGPAYVVEITNFDHSWPQFMLKIQHDHFSNVINSPKWTDALQACRLEATGVAGVWRESDCKQQGEIIQAAGRTEATWISLLLLVKIAFPLSSCCSANLQGTRLQSVRTLMLDACSCR